MPSRGNLLTTCTVSLRRIRAEVGHVTGSVAIHVVVVKGRVKGGVFAEGAVGELWLVLT